MQTNVVIYVRVSTSDQEGGLETQRAVIEEEIKTLGFRNVLKIFVDEEISGDSHIKERPAFKELLSFTKEFDSQNPNDSIKELWVQTRDRIAREVDMLGYAVVLLRDLGVIIRTTDELDEMLVTRIFDILGEEELKKTRRNRKLGTERRLKQKKILSRPPLGYKVENGFLVVDEEKRSMIVEIFKMFEEDITMSYITMKFGLVRSTLAWMRRNPIYRTGEYVYKGKVAYNVEPIIVQEN